MTIWCSVDSHGEREIWDGQPVYKKGVTRKIWLSEETGSNLLFSEEDLGDLFNAIFPKNIKPGECKQVTIKRWEVDDG